jgi:hypothetical protein
VVQVLIIAVLAVNLFSVLAQALIAAVAQPLEVLAQSTPTTAAVVALPATFVDQANAAHNTVTGKSIKYSSPSWNILLTRASAVPEIRTVVKVVNLPLVLATKRHFWGFRIA